MRTATVAPSDAFLRVLIVDDDRDCAESLAILLRMYGHDVHLAFDGRRAIESAARVSNDVVVLDLGLPGVSGYEVAVELKRMGRPSFVIAVSGYGREEDRLRSRDAGVDLHLLKPADPQALIGLLEKFRRVIGGAGAECS